MGEDANISLTLQKAKSQSRDQLHFTLFFVRLVSGDITEEKSGTKRRYQNAVPTKQRVSETVVGTGILIIAWTYSGSGLRPSRSTR